MRHEWDLGSSGCSSHTRSYLEEDESCEVSSGGEHHLPRDNGGLRSEQVVTKALLATKIHNLEELRYLFEDETKIDPFLTRLQLREVRMLQGARLRRVWTAVMWYYKNQHQDRSKVRLSDLDTMLADS